ncbi:MAG: glycosyltransferase family 4 protein, partial [Bacteroidota bacterium]|nr:glycosyltransferase family 4 protein [Bacteroidota bacterium]
IEVIYVKNPYSNNMGIVSRLWSFIRFMFLSTWIGLRQKNIDLVFATSTPLTIGIPALIIKNLKGIPYIFEVRDLWPEVPIQMGAIKSKFIINLLNWFEKKIYTSAKHVVALSPGMRDGVIKTGISPSKVTMIPNMAKKDEFFVRAKNWEIARAFNLNINHFNVVHFGAMGIANGLEYVVKAAAVLKERNIQNVDFIFLGEGKTETDLKDICESKQLTNVKFLGKHPMKIVSEIVNICDCSMVSFSDIPILYTNSPNKLFDSLSAGKPLIVNSAGWTKDMVEENNCGVYVNPQRPEDLADTVLKMAANPVWLQEMSVNSRRLAEEVYDKTILCKKFIKVIEANNVQKPAETFS